MKKTIILLSMIGLNLLSASTINTERATHNREINILIDNDVLVVRDARQPREAREARQPREARHARESRVVRMGRNSRGIRVDRDTRIVYKTPESKKVNLASVSFIKKTYLSKLSK